ncbi:MAG TPA: glutathione S-transferase family protein [Steroidobacteraceae bacterium]|nr:glutathione S-transferase family protein [Steroidobacteraceae bacterium]
MILIGMFDSPFVRRVAVSMQLLGIGFEHRNWSVGKDFDRIRQYNPLGQVPTLALDDGEVLVESAAILDYLDEVVGPDRALVPRSGAMRRTALQLMSLAMGSAEKGRSLIYEGVFRPEDKRHEPWVDRCRTQMYSTLTELERRCQARSTEGWLFGSRVMQPDITLACAFTFLKESVLESNTAAYPTLCNRTEQAEALTEFKSTYESWGPPRSP